MTEEFVQIVDEVMTVKEEKDEGNTKKNTIWTNFSVRNITIKSSIGLSFLVIGKECFIIEFWVRCWHSGDASPSPNLHSPGNYSIFC